MSGTAKHQHDPRHTTFGALLRYYRETYLERIGGKARMVLSAKALIQCMGESGYSIGQGFLSEIEHGAAYPAEGGRFIKAVTTCLQLSPVDRWRLIMQFNYDVVKRNLGEDIANEIYDRDPTVYSSPANQALQSTTSDTEPADQHD